MRRFLCVSALIGASVICALPAGARPARPHIIVIVMENHGAGSIIGNRAARFENSLAGRYVTLTNWTGVDHPSGSNYVALTTGQDNHKAGRNDCTPSYPRMSRCDYDGRNLGVQLAAAGIPARWYAEDLRRNGCSIKNAQSGRGDVNHERQCGLWLVFVVQPAMVARKVEAGVQPANAVMWPRRNRSLMCCFQFDSAASAEAGSPPSNARSRAASTARRRVEAPKRAANGAWVGSRRGRHPI